MKKTFQLADVLTIVTSRLVAERGIEAVYDILNHMTGDNLFTHQLPRASRECEPWLLRWFPELAQACGSTKSLDAWLTRDQTPDKREGIKMWIAELRTMFPDIKDSYEIDQIPRDDHDTIDPIQELAGMVGKEKIVVVKT